MASIEKSSSIEAGGAPGRNANPAPAADEKNVANVAKETRFGPSSSDRSPEGVFSSESDPEADPEALVRVSSGPEFSTLSPAMKRWVIATVTYLVFISPVTAQIYFPALNDLATDLNVSVSLINLTMTTFMIFQGISPTMGKAAETWTWWRSRAPRSA
jgi:hypothetical protein